jgi:hypothetical protein
MADQPALPSIPPGSPERTTQHWLFGSSPLIKGEDRAAYAECFARISGAVKCQDFLMEIWVNDIVNLTWDTIRYRRAKANFLSVALFEAIRDQLGIMLGDEAGDMAEKWARRDSHAIEEVERVLAGVGLSTDALTAGVLMDDLETIALMDRLIASAEFRRDSALHELERHRANLARALRHASNDVVDAEFEEFPPPAKARNAA